MYYALLKYAKPVCTCGKEVLLHTIKVVIGGRVIIGGQFFATDDTDLHEWIQLIHFWAGPQELA